MIHSSQEFLSDLNYDKQDKIQKNSLTINFLVDKLKPKLEVNSTSDLGLQPSTTKICVVETQNFASFKVDKAGRILEKPNK